MISKKKTITALFTLSLVAVANFLTACKEETPVSAGISPQKMADALHIVMLADRTTYVKKVVQRLTKVDSVIHASEFWQDEKALPLPAQMFRMGSELASEKTKDFSYGLISKWPINKQNEAKTEIEKKALDFIQANPGQNFYGEETLGGKTYFTALYPDVAVASACSDCHNKHKDSPKHDFKVGDTMGGVIIRIPL